MFTAKDGYCHDGLPAVVVQQLQMRVEINHREIGYRYCMTLEGCTADQCRVQLDAYIAEPGQQLGTARLSASNRETPLALEVLHDRSTVAAGESDGVLDDVGQHLVQDQARSDGLADLA